jgi:hypothetical protein
MAHLTEPHRSLNALARREDEADIRALEEARRTSGPER